MNENFKGVFIPAKIYLIQDLSIIEKILILTIQGLDNGSGCFASNEYLAKFAQISVSSCSSIITSLKSKNILFEPKKFDGRKRYLSVNMQNLLSLPTIKTDADFEKDLGSITNSIIQPTEICEPAYQNLEGSIIKNSEQPTEICEHINIDINIDTNIDYKEKSKIEILQPLSSNNQNSTLNIEKEKSSEPLLPTVVYEKKQKPQQKKRVTDINIYPANFSSAMIRAVQNYFEYRKEINKPFKSEKSIITKISQFSEQIDKFGEPLVLESIDTAISNGWQGTFIDMKKAAQQNNFNNNQNTSHNGNLNNQQQQFVDFITQATNFEL